MTNRFKSMTILATALAASNTLGQTRPVNVCNGAITVIGPANNNFTFRVQENSCAGAADFVVEVIAAGQIGNNQGTGVTVRANQVGVNISSLVINAVGSLNATNNVALSVIPAAGASYNNIGSITRLGQVAPSSTWQVATSSTCHHAGFAA